MQQLGNIIVIRDGAVDENIAICSAQESSDIVGRGRYAGKQLSESLEAEFYRQCRRINPSLPADWESLGEEELEELEDFPDFDGGFYEHNGASVCLTWATIV